ncbi:MAG: hypothetical protein R6T96_05835, partial [Longimicrobiales bacterium]
LRTGDHPAMNLVNVSGAELSSLSGNQEVLFSLEGTETTDIVIESQDIEQTRSKMVTDYGIFIPVIPGLSISSWPGQQVSIFAMDKEMQISST